MDFIVFISFLILLRVGELFLAMKNEKWLTKHGAVEYGKGHHPFIMLLHALFLLSMAIEYRLREDAQFNSVFLATSVLLIITEMMVIASLGKYWNTKVFRFPGSFRVRRRIYHYLRHPNYLLEILEIIFIPLVFELYVTALLFSLLNVVILYLRISEERKVWSDI